MFVVGKQLAQLVPFSSIVLKSGYLPSWNGERQMASSGWLGHRNRSRDTWAPVLVLSQTCWETSANLSISLLLYFLQSIAETISSVPDCRTGVLQTVHESWVLEESFSYQFESRGIVRQDWYCPCPVQQLERGPRSPALEFLTLAPLKIFCVQLC